MIEDLIIIIPTHNRQHYLGRVIKYYSSFPCKVYICDSSKQKANVETLENISYRWVPQSNFYGKVLDVINETSAGYYALSPDDDFLKEETLIECFDNLNRNKGFSLGIGRQVFFKKGLNEGFYSGDRSNRLLAILNTDFLDKEHYVDFFWHHYQNILWSLFRREELLAAFTSLNRNKYGNGNFIEITLGIECLRSGCVYVYQNGLNYREVIEGEHWGNTTLPITRANIKKDKALKKDVNSFIDYYKQDGGFAIACLNSYLDAGAPKTYSDKIKALVPDWLKIIVKKSANSKPTTIERPSYNDKEMLDKIALVLK